MDNVATFCETSRVLDVITHITRDAVVVHVRSEAGDDLYIGITWGQQTQEREW